MESSDLVHFVTVPLFTGAIGYLTNLSGVWMLFNPVRFRGFKLPGLQALAQILPRKVQEIPGIMHGGVGWQGIIPSRAAKMGSIAVDKGIAKVGSPADFYQQLEPDKIAEQILVTAQRDIRTIVERTMEREHPQLWHDLPPRAREAVHQRVREQLPDIVKNITDQIGTNIDQLLDVKLMVIRHLEKHPEIANAIFQEVGDRELRFMTNFGFWFGLLLGIPVAWVDHEIDFFLLLPLLGTVVGYITNLLAIWLIFEPTEPTKWGPFRLHGLFLRRQREAADIYARIISTDIITIRNIGTELLEGPRADRTRQMIQTAMRPAVDRAVGRTRSAVRVAMGTKEYDAIRESVASEVVDYTITPLQDPEFNERQSKAVHNLISLRMSELDPPDFSEMLRSAMKEDEWLLFLHGAVLGFGAGIVHVLIFGI